MVKDIGIEDKMQLTGYLKKAAFTVAAGIAYLASYVVPVHGESIESYLLGDVNRDGIVNIIDLTTVAQHFGETITSPLDPNPDVNGDGEVDILDLVIVGRDYGKKANRRPVIELDGQLFEVQLTFDGQMQKAYDYEVSLAEVIGSKSQFPISAKVYDPDNTTEHPDADPVEVKIEQLDGAGKMAKEYVSRTVTNVETPKFTVTSANPQIITPIQLQWPAHYWYRITATDSNGSETSALVHYKVKMDNGGRTIESGILMSDTWSEEVFQTRSNIPSSLDSIGSADANWAGIFYNWGYTEIEPLPRFSPRPNLGINAHTAPLEDIGSWTTESKSRDMNSIIIAQIGANINLETGQGLPINPSHVGSSIQPSEYWDAWFEQYRNLIEPLADSAASSGAGALTILHNSNVLRYYDSATGAYPLETRWRDIIAIIRDSYSGKIGVSQPLFWGTQYSQNFFMGSSNQIGYYDAMDYIQVPFAPGLTRELDPSIENLNNGISNTIDNLLENTANQTGKPIFLTPIFFSSDGANSGGRGPMNFSATVDMQEQVDQYEALFQAISSIPYIQAVFCWGYWWSEGFNVLDTLTDWSIRTKPAEQAVKLWFEIYK